jgi:hypothetical protein
MLSRGRERSHRIVNNAARNLVAKPVSIFAEYAVAGSIVIQKIPRHYHLIASKNIFRSAETNTPVLYHGLA